MNDATRTQITAALETAMAALGTVIVALNEDGTAPASTAPAVTVSSADDKPFVEWIRETAPARAARKSSNKEMAAWMRTKGLVPNGQAWAAALKGERNVRTLKALNAKDAA